MKWILLLCNMACMVGGQIAWKYAVGDKLDVIKLLSNVWFWTGGILYVAATGIWLLILSKMPLSVAYPLQSFCYVLGIIAGVTLFGERIQSGHIWGSLLILLGVAIIAKTQA
ncbi:EamA family transporter [Ectobacillus ponti]|uniref:EamA family transporter n=1 Tax=Ectobacillus ponti TaxID=2961894 RepID=A0AA42BNS1_9BACI|nr:EamA family transporter [Ectobacillus ponti]MCP8967992.1 EamA family transporter [Ectobacillus ponti]